MSRFNRKSRDSFSILLRYLGMEAHDRMLDKRYRKRLKQTILVMSLEEDDDKDDDYLLLFIYLYRKLRVLHNPQVYKPLKLRPLIITFNSISPFYYDQLIGFSKHDVQRMFLALDFPDSFTLNTGRHAFHVNSQHAFLYFLSRYHSPSQRQTLDMEFWCYDYTTLSKIFNCVVNFIDEHYGYKLRSLHSVVNKLPLFNQKICQKIEQEFPNELPPVAERCALFIDNTRFKISRPVRHQRQHYSKHKKIHNQGVQVVFGPDGMIYDWYDAPTGRHNDKYFQSDSGINSLLRDCQLLEHIKYYCYADGGYTNKAFIKASQYGPLPPLLKRRRYIMSGKRITIEWGFGKMKMKFPFITRIRLMKMLGVDVCKYLRVAGLLTNFHTCLHQSIVSEYFDCPAPSLEEYLND